MVRIMLLALVSLLVAAGCGSGTSSHSRPARTSATTAGNAPSHAASGGPLVAEAQSAAAGDIPDNQVFLEHADRVHGYVIKYPEGWAVAPAASATTIQDKGNVIRIAVSNSAAPTPQSIKADIQQLRAVDPSLTSDAPEASPSCQNGSSHPSVRAAAFHLVYHTRSAPNSVTGKRVTLDVDRYYYAHAGKVAVIDFGTPHGVDNVDAYCQMAVSFRWT